VNAAPHFLYHLFHLDVFSTSDKVLQTMSLAVTVIVPALLLLHAWRAPRQHEVSTPQDGSPAWR
jgi:hypothetical protein